MIGSGRDSIDRTDGVPPDEQASGERRDLHPDRGSSGWEEVALQDELHWTVNTDQDELADQAKSVDHVRNTNLAEERREEDGPADIRVRPRDPTPETHWEQDDYRRTDFAGSRDSTNHPSHPPDINGQPPIGLDPE